MTSPYPYTGIGVFSPKALSYSLARKQVAQSAYGDLGVTVVGPDSKPVDATDVSVRVTLDTDFDGTTSEVDGEAPEGREIASFSGSQVRHDPEDPGVYTVTLTPEHTAERGNLTAVWTFSVDGSQATYVDYLQIIEQMPTYDALRPEEQDIVQRVSWMFADLFDSTNGGPNLMEQFQSHFGFERIAQLMHLAMNRINTYGVPMTNFGLGEGSTKLPEGFDGFLMMGTYLEVLRHLIRSYTEQPNLVAMTVTYTDRRDYAQRWRSILDEEKQDYLDALKLAKRKLLGLGGGSLLVAGGIYGGAGRSFYKSSYAMQARAARFYPYASIIVRR
ncbi:hypothetical protein SEA_REDWATTLEHOG_34 [Gordonia phage RedWattleHog]|uniref:Uncharacterized protein n=1 Tax=Gordonia phage Stormageddon TaxID=2656541 RepID=A0A649VRS0_9CAUD|nr:hypothetical protein KHQ86_gp031 [Gordonia phage Stormageddon]QGJ94894.1 hypothetical protein SEA_STORMAGEDDON_31 [Gordonia phage Stormageddon]QLF83538.1 hypothetical protein SEA_REDWATTLEHOG_34 [Gordonia phage RedWattleHog]